MAYNVNHPQLNHNKTILPSGLTILSINNPSSGLVAFEALVKVGSRYESQDISGISHYVEHVNFKGTTKRTSKDIAEEIENVGGSFNAGTSQEHTSYSITILREYAPLAIDMICDIMLNSTFPEAELEKEKKVVIQEIAQREDSPPAVTSENLMRVIYKDQPLGRSIAGTPETVGNITREDIIKFTSQYYIPSNIIFSAAGNIDHQELVNLVQEKCVRPSNQVCSNFEPANFSSNYIYQENAELSQTNVIISYEAVNKTSTETYKYTMLSNILGNGFSSRLFQALREKSPLVYSIGSDTDFSDDTGLFSINFSATNDNLMESFEAISDELKKLTYTITQKELDKFVAQIKFGLCFSNENSMGLASRLNNNYADYSRIISNEEIFEEYSSITIENLHDLASEIFRSPVSISMVGQNENIPSYDLLQNILIIKDN